MARTRAQIMYDKGYDASHSSPHDLDYWDDRFRGRPPAEYRAFQDGWSDAATGEDNYRSEYYPD